MAETAVVILNWNGRDYLQKFLPGLAGTVDPSHVEIVVADNGSTDGSVEWLAENHPEVTPISFDKNYGFAEGYNKAFRGVDAEFYVLLNSDVEVTAGWLESLIGVIKENPDVAAVMPKVLSYTEKGKFEYAGACGGYIDWLGYPFCRGRVIDAVEKDEGQYDTVKEVFWTTGACMVVRSFVYHEAGGLDGDFFAHQEEIDLCWRMQSAGYRLLVCPQSVVYHIGGGTLHAESPFKVYLNYRNNLSMLLKNLSGLSVTGVLFIRLILDGLSAVIYLLKGEKRSFAAVFKAHIHFYKRLPELLRKRRKIQKKRKKSPAGIYRGSVMWRYYTGRKTSPIR